MYEELVKRLREPCKYENCILCQEAADAIEELQQTVSHYKGCADDLYKEACDYKDAMPRWISVKDRLPEKQGEEYLVLISYPNGETDRVVLWYDLGIEPFFWNRIFVPRGTITHWMPLPAPPKEETNV